MGTPNDPEAADDEHPIFEQALALLDLDAEGCYQLSADNQATLEAAIDQHLTAIDLPIVVDAILRLAHVLEVEAASELAAAALCSAIEREAVVRGLRERNPLDGQEAADSARAFQSFAQTEARVLPKEGSHPEGAVKLDAFKAPRRV